MSIHQVMLVDPDTNEVVYKEVSGSQSKVLEALQGITKVSIERNIIPNKCPICKSEPIVENGKFLVLHHWGAYKKLACIEKGAYRRICRCCNSYIGQHLDLDWLYSDEATWEQQFNLLRGRFERDKHIFPNFDGVEGYWSKLIPGEFGVFEELMIKGKYPRTKKAIEQAMKTVQRELPNDKLKVEILDILVDLVEKVGKDGR